MRSSLLQSLGNLCLRNLSAFPGYLSPSAPTELLPTQLNTVTRGFRTEIIREACPPNGACRSLYGQRHDRASFLSEPTQLLSLKVTSSIFCSSLSCMELRTLLLQLHIN